MRMIDQTMTPPLVFGFNQALGSNPLAGFDEAESSTIDKPVIAILPLLIPTIDVDLFITSLFFLLVDIAALFACLLLL